MPRISHKIADSKKLADAQPEGGARYSGPKPPKGIYKGVVRFLKVRGKRRGKKFVPQENRNGDYMIAGAVQLRNTGDKSKYNGYLVNFNQNVSKQGSGYVNTMLDAMFDGSQKVRQEFWADFVGTDLDGLITHIGRQRYTDNSIEVVINTKDGKDNNGLPILDVAAWLSKNAMDNVSDDEEDESEDDDDVEFEDDESEDEEDSDEDDDESDEFEDEDDADEDSEEEDEDGDEDDEDDSEEDEEEASDEGPKDPEWNREQREGELKALSRKDLLAIRKERGLTGATKSLSEADLIEGILDAEEEEPPF